MFIYSSVDGHLVCSHVLGIVNIAAIYIGVIVPFLNYDFFQDICSGVRLLDIMVVLFFYCVLLSIINLKCCVSFRCITE